MVGLFNVCFISYCQFLVIFREPLLRFGALCHFVRAHMGMCVQKW